MLGLAIGGLPAWIYAARHADANLAVFVTQPAISPAVSGAARHGRSFLGAAITVRYASCVAPRVLDGGLPGESLAFEPLRLLLLAVPLAALVTGIWLAVWRRRGPYVRPALPLLYMAVVTVVFCLGTSAWAATKSCSADLAGRYAVPLALVLPLVLLALPALPALVSVARARRAPRLAILRIGRRIAVAVLCVLVPVQLATYVLASPTRTFQSPYYDRVPADVPDIVAALRARGITDVWANHWLGNIVTFDSDGTIICADYYDQVVRGGIPRPPGSLAAAARAPEASFLLMVSEQKPLLARELDALGVPYTLARLPGNVILITPDRRVDPATVIPGLGEDYASS